MEISQYYETLVQRDLNFYVLPGSFTLLGELIIFKYYGIDELWKKVITNNISDNIILNVVLFLGFSYIVGYILYMVHNRTIGSSIRLKRHLILQKYIFPQEPSETILKMRSEMVTAIFGDSFTSNIEKLNNMGDLLQLYFNADKYIRQKNKDFYLTYIGRLTATSRFCGVMSIACGILAISLLWVFFYFQAIFIVAITLILIAVFFILSFWFFKQSITDQEELVWNIVQSIYLIQNNEKNQPTKETIKA